jgi:hypothetical protein
LRKKIDGKRASEWAVGRRQALVEQTLTIRVIQLDLWHNNNQVNRVDFEKKKKKKKKKKTKKKNRKSNGQLSQQRR